MNAARISDLTVDQLMTLIRAAVREALEEHDSAAGHAVDPRGLLDVPPLSVGPWPDGLKLLSREEYYD